MHSDHFIIYPVTVKLYPIMWLKPNRSNFQQNSTKNCAHNFWDKLYELGWQFNQPNRGSSLENTDNKEKRLGLWNMTVHST